MIFKYVFAVKCIVFWKSFKYIFAEKCVVFWKSLYSVTVATNFKSASRTCSSPPPGPLIYLLKNPAPIQLKVLHCLLGVRGFFTSPCSDSILFLDCFVSSGCGCFQSMSDATSGSFNISLQLSPGIQMGIKHDGKHEK